MEIGNLLKRRKNRLNQFNGVISILLTEFQSSGALFFHDDIFP